MALLKIKDLKKSFNNKLVLEGVNLTVHKGDVIVIIGPSGSGKTTLLKDINLLEQPDSGQLILNNHKFNLKRIKQRNKLWIRKRIAMVFQNYSLFKNKNALENIMEGLIYGKDLPRDKAKQIALKELKFVGLLHKKDFYPSQLSGGQQQRIGIARATALDPELILFDEPTSALDPELVGTVVSDINRLARNNQTMIVVTHLMSFAKQIATKVAFFDQGNILEVGTPNQIFNHPRHHRIKDFLSAISRDQ